MFTLVVVLIPCSGVHGFLFDEDEPEAGQQPAEEQEVFSQTLADSRLTEIYLQEQALFEELEKDALQLDEAEYQRRLRSIATLYEGFLLDNEDYAYGYLMYGKFLRRAGQPRAANNAFMKANMIDPNIAVAKQQIGNFLAEEGEYGLALPYYLAAIELEPDVALYRYQLGELLHRYRRFFID
ncbi:MAG: hypothetical protein AAGF10_00235 [Verrucomicrobiota bacterium]